MTETAADARSSLPRRRARRRLLGVGAALGVALAAALAYVFDPDVQRAYVLRAFAPAVDSLAIEALHATPWSVRARGVEVRAGGGRLRVGRLAVNFNPLALLTSTVSITSLKVSHTDLDLRGLPPSPPAATPFPGLLPTLEKGYALALSDVDATLSVLLQGDHALTVRLRDGNIKPHVDGALGVAVSYVAPEPPTSVTPAAGSAPSGADEAAPVASAPTPAAVDSPNRIDIEGELNLDQLSRGRLRALRAALDVTLALTGLPQPEHVRLHVRVAPPPGLQGNPYHRRQRVLADGTRTTIPNPEAVSLALEMDEVAGAPRAKLTLDGLYRGEDGVFSGGYWLRWRDALLLPYIVETAARKRAAAPPLPAIVSETSGALQVETLTRRGLVTLDSVTAVSGITRLLGEGQTMPDSLTVRARGNGTFEPTRVELAALTLGVAAADGFTPFSAHLTAPVAVDPAVPARLLTQPRELMQMVLGPVPLRWLDGLVPGHVFDGHLTGSFSLGIDAEQRVKLDPLIPTRLKQLRVSAIGTTPEAAVLVDGMDISVAPTASWSEDFLRAALNDVTVVTAGQTLATTTLQLASRQGGEPPREWRARIKGRLALDPLRTLPIVATRLADVALPPDLPAGLAATLKGLVTQRGDTLGVEKLEFELAAPSRPGLLAVIGLQPVRARRTDAGLTLVSPRGEFARFSLADFNLDWLSAALPGWQLDGAFSGAALTLSATAADALRLASPQALRLSGVTLAQNGRSLLRGIDFEALPDLRYGPDALGADLTGLRLRAQGRDLARGALQFALREPGASQPDFSLDGELALDVNALLAQPMLRDVLPAALPAATMALAADFALRGNADVLDVAKLDAQARVGPRARLVLAAEPGLAVRRDVPAGEDLAEYVKGALALDIKDLPSATLSEFIDLGGISFAEINAQVRLRSDGRLLRLNTLAPLEIGDVRIARDGKVLFESFNLGTTAALRVDGRNLRGSFEEATLAFAGRNGTPALAADFKLEIAPDRTVPLTLLDATLRADLPQLLAQPAVLPGHGLRTGTLALSAKVDAERRLDARVLLSGLAGSAPLAIETFDLPMQGAMLADGRGFDFTAPLSGRGKSGETTARVVGHYAPQPDEIRVLNLGIASEVFYLNDILATIDAIRPRGAATAADSTTPARRGPVRNLLNLKPDDKAAWKLIGPALIVDVEIGKLFYTDYLAFEQVGGRLDLRSRRLALKGIHANFHASPLVLDGVARFRAGTQDPYDLALAGGITDFDLNAFFTELLPDQQSRVEGLFGVNYKAYGQFPNFTEARNRVLFDVDMQSREGLFRPLPADSPLMLGASGVLGLVGEGLSYLPTGGFGAGAVARLVNYIAEIDYDTIDIHLKRDASLNIDIEQFQVLSPTIALTVSGGISHAQGLDVFDSPLELNGSLDMLGRGAAILYSMNLMQDAKDEFGYWRGPEFRIRGTAETPESNFEEIIRKAADGTVKGSITRPISGLIGNLKYRWFHDDQAAKDAARAAARRRREERAGGGEDSGAVTPTPE